MYKLSKKDKEIGKTLNYKKSNECFTEKELEMIKEIKKAGYVIIFYKDMSGAEILEPFKSKITGKIKWLEVCYATTIQSWDNNIYPLKEWYENLIK